MFARIRDQMGDLMTEEDLKKLVDGAMHKAFFEELLAKMEVPVGEESGIVNEAELNLMKHANSVIKKRLGEPT